VLPEKPTRTLLFYMHGIVPPTPDSPQKTNFQQVLANATRRAGIAALIPRGVQGFSSKRHPEWWTWPNAPSSYREQLPALLERFRRNQNMLEELAGVSFTRVYLAGSSAGAYFVCALALQGDFEAAGFGAMSGGAWRSNPKPGLLPKPFYIGYGTYDRVGESARALGDLLERAGWPVRVAPHPLGHGAREVYLDEALAFWQTHASDAGK
jgi:predicted esterase